MTKLQREWTKRNRSDLLVRHKVSPSNNEDPPLLKEWSELSMSEKARAQVYLLLAFCADVLLRSRLQVPKADEPGVVLMWASAARCWCFTRSLSGSLKTLKSFGPSLAPSPAKRTG